MSIKRLLALPKPGVIVLLLAPVTADIVTAGLLGSDPPDPELAEPFAPARFAAEVLTCS